MKIVSSPFPWTVSQTVPLPAGEEFLVFDVTAAQMLTQTTGNSVRDANPEPFAPDKDFPIMIVQPGSFGDLILLTPLIRKLRITYPLHQVFVSCLPQYSPVLQGLVDDIIVYPFHLNEIPRRNLLWMEHVLETPCSRRYVNRYAEVAGMAPLESEGLDYLVQDSEREVVSRKLPKSRPHRIGVQVTASSIHKSWTIGKMAATCDLLRAMPEVEVVLLCGPQEISIPDIPEGIVNISPLNFSIREAAAVIETCESVIVMDSVYSRLANALGIPSVVLGGPFDPALTQAFSRTVNRMTGVGDCKFCSAQTFPAGRPCSRSNFCHVIDSIPNKDIAYQALHLAGLLK